MDFSGEIVAVSMEGLVGRLCWGVVWRILRLCGGYFLVECLLFFRFPAWLLRL